MEFNIGVLISRNLPASLSDLFRRDFHIPSLSTMADPTLQPAILIVSDTASEDPSTDKVVDALTPLLLTTDQSPWKTPFSNIVPDNVLDIQRSICDWTDGQDAVNLVLLSGGTGFTSRDNTPEVCRITGDAVNPPDLILCYAGGDPSPPSSCSWTCVCVLGIHLTTVADS